MLETNLRVLSSIGYQRYLDLLKEAQDARQARQATAHQNTVVKRFLTYVGDILISSGYRLKQRYEPECDHTDTPVFQVEAKGAIVI
jgi:hypothetical protein